MTIPIREPNSILVNLNYRAEREPQKLQSKASEIFQSLLEFTRLTGICAGTTQELDRSFELLKFKALNPEQTAIVNGLANNVLKTSKLAAMISGEVQPNRPTNLQEALTYKRSHLPPLFDLVGTAMKLMSAAEMPVGPIQSWKLTLEEFYPRAERSPLDSFVVSELIDRACEHRDQDYFQLKEYQNEVQKIERWNEGIDRALNSTQRPENERFQSAMSEPYFQSLNWRDQLACLQRICNALMAEEWLDHHCTKLLGMFTHYFESDHSIPMLDRFDLVRESCSELYSRAQAEAIDGPDGLYAWMVEQKNSMTNQLSKLKHNLNFKELNQWEAFCKNINVFFCAYQRTLSQLEQTKVPEIYATYGETWNAFAKSLYDNQMLEMLMLGLSYLFRFHFEGLTNLLLSDDRWVREFASDLIPSLVMVNQTYCQMWDNHSNSNIDFYLKSGQILDQLSKVQKAYRATAPSRAELYKLAFAKLCDRSSLNQKFHREAMKYRKVICGFLCQKNLPDQICELTTPNYFEVLPEFEGILIEPKLNPLKPTRNAVPSTASIGKLKPGLKALSEPELPLELEEWMLETEPTASSSSLKPGKKKIKPKNKTRGPNPAPKRPETTVKTDVSALSINRDLAIHSPARPEVLQIVEWGSWQPQFTYHPRTIRWLGDFSLEAPLIGHSDFVDEYQEMTAAQQIEMIQRHRLLPLADFFCLRGSDFKEKNAYGETIRYLVIPAEMRIIAQNKIERGMIVWAINSQNVCFHRYFHKQFTINSAEHQNTLEVAMSKIEGEAQEAMLNTANTVRLNVDNYRQEIAQMHRYKNVAVLTSAQYSDIELSLTLLR